MCVVRPMKLLMAKFPSKFAFCNILTNQFDILILVNRLPRDQICSETTNKLADLDESLADCGQFRIDIRELTILEITENFRTGRLTSQELTQCYIERISEMDDYLRSVIELNPEAIELAERADMERSAGYIFIHIMYKLNVRKYFF